MKDWQSMAHVKWECKYHIVFIPKYRKKALYDKLRKRVGEIFQQLCKHKGLTLLEGHARACAYGLKYPAQYSVSMVIGYIKGKSAIRVHWEFMGRKKQFTGFHFWAPGYCVCTIGLDEQPIREYVKNKERIERGKHGQLNLPDFE